ncbi:MAG: prepilin-type N-terminal cleavage/methylation domain-containing protein [Saccharospirillaceae bacterium]|nr:prepilin-type N-terminal cleavage/methylation domain-containing protein [Pseudomonadales bacterium]NRB77084.1 prepilin-type N-terminal cleavage/methylation domain-containing protein [Saccharospirillaceae bacterium]
MNQGNKYVNNGFSLIELMVVVAILGIIMGIAVPSYSKYVKSSNRTDATIALESIRGFQTKFKFVNNVYASNVSDVGGSDTEHGYYVLSVSTAKADTGCSDDGVCFIATASVNPASDSQSGDVGCTTMTIESNGRKLPEDCF